MPLLPRGGGDVPPREGPRPGAKRIYKTDTRMNTHGYPLRCVAHANACGLKGHAARPLDHRTTQLATAAATNALSACSAVCYFSRGELFSPSSSSLLCPAQAEACYNDCLGIEDFEKSEESQACYELLDVRAPRKILGSAPTPEESRSAQGLRAPSPPPWGRVSVSRCDVMCDGTVVALLVLPCCCWCCVFLRRTTRTTRSRSSGSAPRHAGGKGHRRRHPLSHTRATAQGALCIPYRELSAPAMQAHTTRHAHRTSLTQRTLHPPHPPQPVFTGLENAFNKVAKKLPRGDLAKQAAALNKSRGGGEGQRRETVVTATASRLRPPPLRSSARARATWEDTAAFGSARCVFVALCAECVCRYCVCWRGAGRRRRRWAEEHGVDEDDLT